ncbi:MAG: flippase, partial [Patescibacteria group bacterium]|nr:flippase [Patescibacteria group bacterium]
FFQSTVQAKVNVRVSMLTTVVTSLLKILLIVSGKGIIWLMLIFIFESLFGTVFGVINYKKQGYKFNTWRFDKQLAKEIWSGSWMMMLAASASYLLLKVDQVMVKQYLGEASVGLYAAAVRLVELWYFVPGLVCSSLFPAIVNAKKVDEKLYKKRLYGLYLLLGLIAVLIAIPSTILAPWVINLLFGGAYLGAVGILRIYVWSGVGLFLLWGFQQYFLSENRLMTIFYLYLFSTLVNISLNLVLIPKFGLTGAAWATLVAYSAGPVAAFIVMNTRKIVIRRFS